MATSDADPEASRAAGAGDGPLEVGLTGSIGAGKSTVARALARRGAVVIDADALARAATEDPAVLERIAAELGDDLVRDGRLDRAATAARVFDDPEAREVLNAIVHPRVAEERETRVREARARRPAPPVIVHDVPLLFEVGLDEDVDLTVAVAAPLATRIARVVERSGLDADEVRRRDASQMPQHEKVARADVVIDNGGDEAALEAQLDRLWRMWVGRDAARS